MRFQRVENQNEFLKYNIQLNAQNFNPLFAVVKYPFVSLL